MKSILGGALAAAVALAFAFCLWRALRPDAGWLDAQPLFVIALPYNWTLVKLTGESNFAPDAPGPFAAAVLYEAAVAYVFGALLQALAQMGWRRLRGRS